MIKIPSSTNKSEKERKRERSGSGGGRECQLSLALSLLCGMQKQQRRRQWQKQQQAANLELREDVAASPWLCHHLSWHVSSPACVSLSILTRHRERERERETGQSSVPPPSLYPLLLCPFLPFCFPVFKSASELLCLKVGQSLNCWGVESGPAVCASVLAVIQTDIGCACLLILAVICFACKFIFQVWWAQKKTSRSSQEWIFK